MSPQQWNEALRPEVPTIEANKFIARIARSHLIANVLLDDMVSTTTLVEALYPIAYAKQSEAGMAARQRIIHALTDRACGKYELRDCMTKGAPERARIAGKDRVIRRNLWHAPKLAKTCPTCGQEIHDF